jgi:predicted nucleotide-binding protein
LNQQLARGEYLLSKRPISSDDYSTWELVTKNVLEKAFGRGSPNVTSITSVGKYGFGFSGRTAAEYEADRANDLTTQLTKMRGLIELLGTEAELQTGGAAHTHPKVNGHRIFLVHGHDDHALQLVSRFMEKLGQEVVVLREQPNKGRTIIEKFEDYSDVGFAVVLLTADDRGGSKDIEFANQKLLARQNVIFELGYFIGRLGRNRVCALYRSGVEIPSDYSGVLYQELDEKGAWRLELARELKAAGLPIDMNNAL